MSKASMTPEWSKNKMIKCLSRPCVSLVEVKWRSKALWIYCILSLNLSSSWLSLLTQQFCTFCNKKKREKNIFIQVLLSFLCYVKEGPQKGTIHSIYDVLIYDVEGPNLRDKRRNLLLTWILSTRHWHNRVFTSVYFYDPGDLGSIPGRVFAKTQRNGA